MSKHWNPDESLLSARSCVEPSGKAFALPRGAAAALLLLGLACLSAAIGLYELIGPRDVFASSAGIDWSTLDKGAGR